jgi:hypothetical protein
MNIGDIVRIWDYSHSILITPNSFGPFNCHDDSINRWQVIAVNARLPTDTSGSGTFGSNDTLLINILNHLVCTKERFCTVIEHSSTAQNQSTLKDKIIIVRDRLQDAVDALR